MEPKQRHEEEASMAGKAVLMAIRPCYSGQVLPKNDVRAWTGTLAFPGSVPSQTEVDQHVRWCEETVDPMYPDAEPRVPVLWSFGKVYWERVSQLVLVDQAKQAGPVS